MIADLVRNARPRLLALLAAPDGDLAAAEDAFSDAVEKALREWPTTGVPANPEAWLFTVARNRRRDGWRGAAQTTCLDEKVTTPGLVRDHTVRGGISGVLTARTGTVEDAALEIPDWRLALLAVAAHPAIDPVARTPLMLNTVLGLSAERIGALLLVPTATMAARLTRAKKRIKSSDLRFELPGVDELPRRLGAIRDAIYGAYSVDWMHSAATHRAGRGEAVDRSPNERSRRRIRSVDRRRNRARACRPLRELPQPRSHRAFAQTSRAIARPALSPEKIQPPRNVPSSEL